MLNKSLKCFSQLFVGRRSSGSDDVLAFATPYETNAQGLKRQETVKSWMRCYDENSEQYKKRVSIVDNVPRTGFKVTDDIKRVYWGSGNVVFRVMDPDGWEIEIQSNNLMTLISEVGINKGGEIPGKCIWVRDGALNILLHENSEEFKNLMMNAESISNIKKSDRVIGSTYRLKNGYVGQYLGECWVQALSNEGSEKGNYTTILLNGKENVALKEDHHFVQQKYEAIFFADENAIRFYKTANVIERLDEKVIDKEDAISFINSIYTKKYAVTNYNHTILRAVQCKIDNPVISLCDVTDDDVKQLSKKVTESFKFRKSLFYFLRGADVVKVHDNGEYSWGAQYGHQNLLCNTPAIITEKHITSMHIDEWYSARSSGIKDNQRHNATIIESYENVKQAQEAFLELVINKKLKIIKVVEKQ